MQTYASGVHPIYQYAAHWFGHPEEHVDQRRFPSSCSSNYAHLFLFVFLYVEQMKCSYVVRQCNYPTNLFTRLDGQRDGLKDEGCAFRVTEGHVVQCNVPLLRPVGRWLRVGRDSLQGCLRLQQAALHDSICRHHLYFF